MRSSLATGTFVLASLLFGCGDDDDGTARTDGGGSPDGGRRPDGGALPAARVPTDATTTPIDAPITPPVGSAGCGRAAPATGELTLSVGRDTLQYIVSIPAAYDPSRPYPLGFGLHGANRTHANCQAGDCAGFQSVMQDDAILVYTRSVAPGWQDSNEIRDRNLALFTAALDRMLAEYCVDAGRIFVAGTSSGATFSNILGCALGDRIRAVIPVAGGLPSRAACVGTPAALVIHGVDDPHVLFSYGEDARDAYRAANGCTSETAPPIAGLHGRVVTTRESHECADYLGCDTGLPVRWCEHSEGGYDGSTHGWPLFGGTAIWEFISALP